MTDRELMQMALDVMLSAIKAGDWKVDGACDPDMVLEALRARLAQLEPEPVWVEVTTNTGDKFILDSAVEADKIRAAKNVGLSVVPLYTKEQMKDIAQKLADCALLNSAPPQREWMERERAVGYREGHQAALKQREWQGLTENEIKHLWYEACQTNLELTSQLIVHLARNIEAKLKEKNSA